WNARDVYDAVRKEGLVGGRDVTTIEALDPNPLVFHQRANRHVQPPKVVRFQLVGDASVAPTRPSRRPQVRVTSRVVRPRKGATTTIMPTLQEQFGAIDIYLFDQLLRGHVSKGMTIFDAGCGTGRNIVYLLREGYEVFGIDPDPQAIDAVRRIAPHLPADNFRVESIESHSFPDLFADVVIINTVLHFARDDDHFHAMLHGCWRARQPGGLFFFRLASTLGAGRPLRHLP